MEVRWYDSGCTLLATDILYCGVIGAGWTTLAGSGVAPAGAICASVRMMTGGATCTPAVGFSGYVQRLTVTGVSTSDPLCGAGAYSTDIINYGPTYVQGAGPGYIPAGSTLPPPQASEVPYVNTTSGLSATDVQDAIDEDTARIAALEAGAAGAYISVIGGGGETVQAHGAMGATETFDLADGNVHTGTLDADLTATLTGYSATGDGISFALFLTQDGTGGWGVTWPASVINASDINAALDTTAGALNIIAFVSADGGTSLYGFVAGSGGGSSSLPAAVDGHGLFYDGTTLKTAMAPEPLLLEDGSLAILENGHVAMSEPLYD